MVAQPYRSHMSVEEYVTFERAHPEGRYEFIDGQISMLAGGTADHSIISANIIRELSIALRGSSCRVYTSDMKVRLSEQRYVFPDVSVSCDSRDQGSIEALRYPRLIVEVLSPSTEAYDRGKKFSYYRTCLTIEEYVLVDTQQQAIDVYRREQETFWRLSPLESGDLVKLHSLGVSFPVAAVYENILFPETTENSSSD
ncbi:MAG: Uma2 family endonuclease [Chloroflexota bacterium]|nr:Uma2 family endonuclease [Chloroflexota bacterium]